jgi:hypothetical protein
MRYRFNSAHEEAFALDVPPPDGMDTLEIDEDTYKEIVQASEISMYGDGLPARAYVAPPPPPPPKCTYTMEELARAWLKWESEIHALVDECETEVAKIKAKQKQLSDVLLGQMNAMKADKLETAAGTINRREQTHINVADWGAIWDFVDRTGKREFIQKRLTTTEILKWSAANGGELPPGMNRYTEYKLTVTKPGGRKALPKDDEGAN